MTTQEQTIRMLHNILAEEILTIAPSCWDPALAIERLEQVNVAAFKALAAIDAAAVQEAGGIITAEALLRSVYARTDLSEHGREQFLKDFMQGTEELTLNFGDFQTMAATLAVTNTPAPLPQGEQCPYCGTAGVCDPAYPHPRTTAQPVAAQPAPTDTMDWTISHNGKSVTSSSLAKAAVAAASLRTEEETRIAAENLMRAIEEDVAQLESKDAELLDDIRAILDDTQVEYHEQGMGCGLEDRGITDKYDAMRYGWDEAIDRMHMEVVTPAINAIDAANAAPGLAANESEKVADNEACRQPVDAAPVQQDGYFAIAVHSDGTMTDLTAGPQAAPVLDVADERELPPLPQPLAHSYGMSGRIKGSYYTPRQMHEYARAAISRSKKC